MLNSKFRCEIPDLQQNMKRNFACVFSTISVPNWLHAFFESHVKRRTNKGTSKKNVWKTKLEMYTKKKTEKL